MTKIIIIKKERPLIFSALETEMETLTMTKRKEVEDMTKEHYTTQNLSVESRPYMASYAERSSDDT
jgi:hypothetical protein